MSGRPVQNHSNRNATWLGSSMVVYACVCSVSVCVRCLLFTLQENEFPQKLADSHFHLAENVPAVRQKKGPIFTESLRQI